LCKDPQYGSAKVFTLQVTVFRERRGVHCQQGGHRGKTKGWNGKKKGGHQCDRGSKRQKAEVERWSGKGRFVQVETDGRPRSQKNGGRTGIRARAHGGLKVYPIA